MLRADWGWGRGKKSDPWGGWALVEVTAGPGWVQGAGSRGAEKWFHSGPILKVEPTGSAEELAVVHGRQRR